MPRWPESSDLDANDAEPKTMKLNGAALIGAAPLAAVRADGQAP